MADALLSDLDGLDAKELRSYALDCIENAREALDADPAYETDVVLALEQLEVAMQTLAFHHTGFVERSADFRYIPGFTATKDRREGVGVWLDGLGIHLEAYPDDRDVVASLRVSEVRNGRVAVTTRATVDRELEASVGTELDPEEAVSAAWALLEGAAAARDQQGDDA